MNDGETEMYLFYFCFFDLLVHRFEKTSSEGSLLFRSQNIVLICNAEIVHRLGPPSGSGAGINWETARDMDTPRSLWMAEITTHGTAQRTLPRRSLLI